MALDHHVSQGLYVSEPDGNLIELYVDADDELWHDDPSVAANSDPLMLRPPDVRTDVGPPDRPISVACDLDYELAAHVPALEQEVGVGGAGEREDLLHGGGEVARG